MIKEEKRLSMEALVSKDDVLNIFAVEFRLPCFMHQWLRSDAPHRKQNIPSFFLLSRIAIFAEVFRWIQLFSWFLRTSRHKHFKIMTDVQTFEDQYKHVDVDVHRHVNDLKLAGEWPPNHKLYLNWPAKNPWTALRLSSHIHFKIITDAETFEDQYKARWCDVHRHVNDLKLAGEWPPEPQIIFTLSN